MKLKERYSHSPSKEAFVPIFKRSSIKAILFGILKGFHEIGTFFLFPQVFRNYYPHIV